MTTQRIIYTRPDGGISIIVPAPGVTLAEVLQNPDVAQAIVDASSKEVVEATSIPTDRTLRGAWRHDTSPAPEKVRVDVPAAKEICHERRRAKRAAEFAPLDVEATIPGKAAQAEAKRQVIRDKHAGIQSAIDAAATADALLAIVKSEGI